MTDRLQYWGMVTAYVVVGFFVAVYAIADLKEVAGPPDEPGENAMAGFMFLISWALWPFTLLVYVFAAVGRLVT